MKEIGINKLLYDRRIELGYSLREASIRLDISKFNLTLIENGYKKVKDKKLQERFIFKYKLEKDFFEKDVLGYPSEKEEELNENIADSKFVKLFKKTSFKIITLILSLGFIALLSTFLYQGNNFDDRTFFSEKFNNAEKYVAENGVEYPAISSKTSSMLLCDYSAYTYMDSSGIDEFYMESLSFFPKYTEYLQFAFFTSCARVDLNEITSLNFLENRYINIFYESRMSGTSERLHFYAYTDDFSYQVAHFSVDYDYTTYKFTYNLIETNDYNGRLTKTTSDNLASNIFKLVFEEKFNDFENSKERFLLANKDIFKYESLEEFNRDQTLGIVESNYCLNKINIMVIVSVVLSTISFALFILSIIVSTAFGNKFIKAVSLEEKEMVNNSNKIKEYKPLPKNNWPSPFIPEALLRIVAFILMVAGSMSLYYIFNAIMDGDIIGTLDSLQFRATVASFTTIGMLLIFFIKLDIIQNKKSTFLLNYILFFAGFIFWVLSILVSRLMTSSPALERFKVILDFLPGNIVWGILAFNLLTSILLSRPKFKNNEKRNTILFRLCAIIPFGYMLASSLIQIGKKLWNWDLPFAVSSLFFTKALIITAFTILYCLVIFVYRKYIESKYGNENAEIYILGNRYQYIKNLLVALVFAVLGLIDLFVGKTAQGAAVGFGSNTGIFFLIPLVLFYHPHMGPRFKNWDAVFNIAYGFSLLIGIIAIISSASIYITSL